MTILLGRRSIAVVMDQQEEQRRNFVNMNSEFISSAM
jgi:hypothetical protein